MHTSQPPRGWSILSGTLVLDKSIAGYFARDHDVRGRCYLRDCRRNCHVDLARLMAAGLGTLSIEQIKRTMQCGRLEGCGMEWIENPNRASLPLVALRGRLAVKVQIKCCSCGAISRVAPDTMIARLKAEKKGDDSTRVNAIPALLTKPCPCGKTSWAVEIAWPDPNTIGGRRLLDEARLERDRHRLREPTDF